jgi:rare lipoprotein A
MPMNPGAWLRRGGWVAWLATIGATALLSACGTTGTAPPAGAEAHMTVPGLPTAPAVPATAARRGGGYYQNDGPGDDVPGNLDDIPEPEPRPEPLHRFANRPYNVLGQSYVPAKRIAPWREQGRASWYGRQFHGKATSSGEPYDMYAMTAAHPTLPIPSYARVTHVGNGRSVVVRINDRGPFHKGRIIDLSYTAAHKLGYINAGSTEVEVEQILTDDVPLLASARPVPPVRGRAGPPAAPRRTPEPAADLVPPLPSASGGGIYLQLGAFSSRVNAESFHATVHQEASAFAERVELFSSGDRFHLHAGPYDTVDEAHAAAARMGTKLKLKPFVVVR